MIRLFEHMKTRIESVEKDNGQLQKDNEQLQKDNGQLQKDKEQQQKEIEQLQKDNEQLRALLGRQPTTAGSGPAVDSVPKEARKEPNSRGYNVRKFHDFPHPEKAAPKKRPETKTVTRTCTADAEFCPDCGDKLSEGCERYARKSKDLIDGKWTETEWDVTKRYCKSCKKKRSAPVPGVLPGEHYGTRVIGIIVFLRCIELIRN